jgi:hypothetical protein
MLLAIPKENNYFQTLETKGVAFSISRKAFSKREKHFQFLEKHSQKRGKHFQFAKGILNLRRSIRKKLQNVEIILKCASL